MPTHRQPAILRKPCKRAATHQILTAALFSVLLSLHISADEVKTAAEIVHALSDEGAQGAEKPVMRLRGLRPRPTQASEPQPERNIDLMIHFATNSAVIESNSRVQIQEIAAATQQLDLRSSLLLILGHTDSRGAAAYNLDLSRRRARAVKQALVDEHGVPGERLQAEGRGEIELLIAPERNPEDYAQNRRVELKLVQRPAPIADPNVPW